MLISVMTFSGVMQITPTLFSEMPVSNFYSNLRLLWTFSVSFGHQIVFHRTQMSAEECNSLFRYEYQPTECNNFLLTFQIRETVILHSGAKELKARILNGSDWDDL
jgi:hypothetical protein